MKKTIATTTKISITNKKTRGAAMVEYALLLVHREHRDGAGVIHPVAHEFVVAIAEAVAAHIPDSTLIDELRIEHRRRLGEVGDLLRHRGQTSAEAVAPTATWSTSNAA